MECEESDGDLVCCKNHFEQELIPPLPALLREVLQLLGKMSAEKVGNCFRRRSV